jgi:TonB family protein
VRAPATHPIGEEDRDATVALQIVVDASGRVEAARVVRSAGHAFDEAALSAVRNYRFTPAERSGRPVRVRMAWTVEFRGAR